MKALDKRQKRLLAGILGVLGLIAGLLLLPFLAPKDTPSRESHVAVIPEADLPGGEEKEGGALFVRKAHPVFGLREVSYWAMTEPVSP